jgi:hypothetical protein
MAATVHDAPAGATLAGQSRVAPSGSGLAVHPPSEAAAAGRRQEPRRAGDLATLSLSQPQSPSPPAGLVLSAKTARVVPSTLAGLDNAVLSPTLADVSGAAAAFGSPSWNDLGQESPLPRWIITPGALIGTRKSSRQLVRETERALERRRSMANAMSLFLAGDPDWHPKGLPAREVTGWSAKSRVNMVRTLATLDWGPVHDLGQLGRVPAMVTLTYPGDWEVVAPDGDTVKRQVRRLLWRYRRAWGEPLAGAWKLEFQRRGAPHLHIFMVPPHGRAGGRGAGAGLAFKYWLSVNWADIVDHPDPVEYQNHLVAGTGVDYAEAHKCSDPKRLAVYFGKHGQYRDKEYQHNVPEAWQAPGKGPGRFWGYWGLKPLAVAVELTGDNYILAARIMRRWSARTRVWDKTAGDWRYVRSMAPAKQRWRDVDESTGEVVWRRRRRRSRVDRFRSGSGFLVVNDGPALARQLARAIEVCGVRQ